MRVHAKGVITLLVIVLIAVAAGAAPAIAFVRVVLILFVAIALAEVVVNMIRHRDTRIRSRLLGSIFVPLRIGPHDD
jgi:hypothetical protein